MAKKMLRENKRVSPDEIYWKKLLKNLDPYNPSEIILKKIEQVKSPKSSILSKDNRDKPMNKLPINLLWDFAFEWERLTAKQRLAAEAAWAIKVIKEDYSDLSKDEVREIFEYSDTIVKIPENIL